ncbi:MAG TPA: lytic transglycosylase domain-containing protein [Vicinamibacterales bacterium]|nr:lytic transglycosylase domain-containing protein [Vicinamibacterales bacterium]
MKYMFALVALAIATPASAELIFFSEQRSMSVASHRFEDDRIIVALRGGGEMSFDRALISKITPDEVPYSQDATGETKEPSLPVAASLGLAGETAYDPLIESAATKHAIDARIVKAVIQVESAFQPRARSPKGAMGLMQLMPKTARQYEARNPYDPASNIDAGTKYLKTLLNEFELPLALAAYNAGEGAVRRFGGIPPYAETQAYVTKILGLLR